MFGGGHIIQSYWHALVLSRRLYHFSPTPLRYICKLVGRGKASTTIYRQVLIAISVWYLIDDLLNELCLSRASVAIAKPLGIPFRVIRKGFRRTNLPIVSGLASFAGDGEFIHAIFRKGTR